MLVLATQNSFEAIASIEDGEIDAPEELFFKFGEAQEKLNALLVNRTPLRTIVDAGLILATELTDLVKQLKQYKVV
jgi:hypothetical protein